MLFARKELRQVLFCQNDKTKEIDYYFKRSNKIELNVLFNGENKLKRLVDEHMGVTYIGFIRGVYSYTVDIIKGEEDNEYSMSFDVKKNKKVIQSDDCSPFYYYNHIDDVPYNQKMGHDFIFP